MKLTSKEAKRQVSRLAGLPRFAELGEVGIAEFIRVLCQYAANEDHAERAMTAWIDSNRWLPSCAELIVMIDSTPERDNAARLKPNWNCEICKGSGFQPIWLLVTFVRHPSGAAKDREEKEITAEVAKQLAGQVDGHSQIVVDAVKPCHCEYGLHLKRLRMARASEDEAKSHKGSMRVA